MKDCTAVVGRQVEQVAQDDAGLASAWTIIRAGLRRDIGARMFDQWLKPVRLGD
ncbi:MAG: chromosomal replication initiator protein DnaA, partial [bacterium]|nr:chromosomal replication initiator protein DnaA [bacterium]